MRAALTRRYGGPGVVEVADVATPTPGPEDVRIRVRAAAVSTGDGEMRRFEIPWFLWLPLRAFLGFRRPRKQILGTDFAGVVDAVGENVTRFAIGDRVFGTSGLRFGAHAEVLCMKASGSVVHIPDGVGDVAAAAIPLGGVNALYFLRRAQIRAGESVLVIGAGGTIGTFGVQLAKAMGAEVTVVDAGDKLGMLRSIGADHVVDYKTQDLDDLDQAYDVIFDVVGKTPVDALLRRLAPKGRILFANPKPFELLRVWWQLRGTDQRVVSGIADEGTDDLTVLAEQVERGELRPVVDRTYPLEDIVEAHRYVESGWKEGNVVVVIGDG